MVICTQHLFLVLGYHLFVCFQNQNRKLWLPNLNLFYWEKWHTFRKEGKMCIWFHKWREYPVTTIQLSTLSTCVWLDSLSTRTKSQQMCSSWPLGPKDHNSVPSHRNSFPSSLITYRHAVLNISHCYCLFKWTSFLRLQVFLKS